MTTNISSPTPLYKTVWHYTTGAKLPLILADGYLATATKCVVGKEMPAVWFSAHPAWEPTATKGVRLPGGHTRNATFEEMGTLVRLGVSSEGLFTWVHHRKTSGLKGRFARAMVQVATMHGSNCYDWFVSYEPVPRSRWLTVQQWSGTTWEDVSAWSALVTQEAP